MVADRRTNGSGFAFDAVGNRFANETSRKPVNPMIHPACASEFSLALHSFKMIDSRPWNFLSAIPRCIREDSPTLAFPTHFYQGDAPEVIGEIQIGQSILKLHPHARGVGNVFNDGIEERLHGALHGRCCSLGIHLGAGVDTGKIELLIVAWSETNNSNTRPEPCVECIVSINFVDHNNGAWHRFQALCAKRNGFGLEDRPPNQPQQNAVNHVHDAVPPSRRNRMAGGIDNIDVVIFVFEGSFLGADG